MPRTDYPTAKEIAEALKGKREGHYWKAHCPNHEDGKASLTITEKEGKVLVHCHACGKDQQEALLDRLRERGLWPDRKPNGKGNGKGHGAKHIVATYDYVDETGELLFQVVRLAPKDFRQRRPDGSGGWIHNVNGVRVVPYRLPELLEAIAGDLIVFVVEGEKDVDTLSRVGIAATCNAKGAGKWTAEHATFLKGAKVVIIPDNDESGRKHAQAVARSLHGLAAHIHVVELPELPPKGDVSDWLSAGHTSEDLWARVVLAPEWTPQADEGAELRPRGHPVNEEVDPPHWDVKPWPEPVSGAELLDSIVAILNRYMVLPEHTAEAIALWILHAWAIDAFEWSPLLIAVSPTKQCGKTTLLTIVYWLTYCSEMASGASASSIFRAIEEHRAQGRTPTFLLDECDAYINDNEELRGTLDSGHMRHAAWIRRTEPVGGGRFKSRRLSTWAPKVLGTIRDVADTLMDRGIIANLQRKRKGDKVERFRMRDSEEFAHLRSRCLRWADDKHDTLANSDPSMPETLDNRPADNWRSLISVADAAGGRWPALGRTTAIALSGVREDDEASIQLLKDIRTIFDRDDVKWLGAKVLRDRLTELEEAPWEKWRNGQPISTFRIHKMLEPYGIKSVKERDANRYVRADFEPAFEAYLPKRGAKCSNSSTTQQDQEVSQAEVLHNTFASVENLRDGKPLKANNCGGVGGVLPGVEEKQE